jgi:hypothetical protein
MSADLALYVGVQSQIVKAGIEEHSEGTPKAERSSGLILWQVMSMSYAAGNAQHDPRRL